MYVFDRPSPYAGLLEGGVDGGVAGGIDGGMDGALTDVTPPQYLVYGAKAGMLMNPMFWAQIKFSTDVITLSKNSTFRPCRMRFPCHT